MNARPMAGRFAGWSCAARRRCSTCSAPAPSHSARSRRPMTTGTGTSAGSSGRSVSCSPTAASCSRSSGLASMSRISARSANYLVDAVEAELRAEGLPADTFAALQPDDLRLAKTASRSTLGFMTEMAFELAWIIADQGGLRRSDINALNQALRRVLWNRGDYVRPIELVNQRLNARASPLEARHKEPGHTHSTQIER